MTTLCKSYSCTCVWRDNSCVACGDLHREVCPGSPCASGETRISAAYAIRQDTGSQRRGQHQMCTAEPAAPRRRRDGNAPTLPALGAMAVGSVGAAAATAAAATVCASDRAERADAAASRAETVPAHGKVWATSIRPPARSTFLRTRALPMAPAPTVGCRVAPSATFASTSSPSTPLISMALHSGEASCAGA